MLIFFVAKISGTKRLHNQNLTETEKSASQPSESAFETKAEVSVHLLPNSRLHADTTGRCRKCTPESFVRSCQKCASLRNPDLGEGVAYRHYHVDLPRLPSVALFQGDIQFVRTFGRHDDFVPLVLELHKPEILAVNHPVFALRFVLDGGNPPAFVIFHRHAGRAAPAAERLFPQQSVLIGSQSPSSRVHATAGAAIASKQKPYFNSFIRVYIFSIRGNISTKGAYPQAKKYPNRLK